MLCTRAGNEYSTSSSVESRIRKLIGLLPLLGKVNKTPSNFRTVHIPGSGKLQELYHSLFPSQNRELVHQQLVIRALQDEKNDIFHPTYFEDYYIPFLRDTPLVVTVFDMIYELFPEYFPTIQDETLRKKKRSVVLKARKVIAISESTKKDLCRLYGLNPEQGSCHSSC